MSRSAGLRFIMVGALALLMSLPLNLVSGVVQDRADYSRQTVATLSDEWGGAQLCSGPLLTVPVTEEVTYDRRREAVEMQGRIVDREGPADATGNTVDLEREVIELQDSGVAHRALTRLINLALTRQRLAAGDA